MILQYFIPQKIENMQDYYSGASLSLLLLQNRDSNYSTCMTLLRDSTKKAELKICLLSNRYVTWLFLIMVYIKSKRLNIILIQILLLHYSDSIQNF